MPRLFQFSEAETDGLPDAEEAVGDLAPDVLAALAAELDALDEGYADGEG